jgi:ABC-type antimicrobial peptide transport system permease subunit
MNYTEPPKNAVRLLRWFCRNDRVEELEGDLYELYNLEVANRSKQTANLLYYFCVFRSFRPFALKGQNMKNSSKIQTLWMHLVHNVKVSNRHLWKHSNSTIINILGLAIGITLFAGIASVVRYELSFNSGIPYHDRIYRAVTDFGEQEGSNRGVPTGAEPLLRESATGIESMTLFFDQAINVTVDDPEKEGMKVFNRSLVCFADPHYFEVFQQYKWLAGNKETAIKEPGSTVLTLSQAEKYFGRRSPDQYYGLPVKYGDSLQTQVTGIVENQSQPNDFVFTDFVSLESTQNGPLAGNMSLNNWNSLNSATQLWLKTRQQLNLQDQVDLLNPVNEYLKEKSDEGSSLWIVSLQPLSDLHFNLDKGNFNTANYPPVSSSRLWTLFFIALAILVVAIFNFVNLEIALAVHKAKEVGIRKTLGTSRGGLIMRLLTQSFLVTFLAGILSVPLMYFGLQAFQDYIRLGVGLDFFSPNNLLIIGLILLGAGLLAGIYPAFVISSYDPGRTLKASAHAKLDGKGSPVFRRTLLGLQFVLSQVLILMTIVVLLQTRFMVNNEMGINKENILYFYLPWKESAEKKLVLVDELRKHSSIDKVFLHSSPAAQSGWATSSITHINDGNEYSMDSHQRYGEPGWVDFYGLNLLAGRDFRATDTLPETIINKKLLLALGYQHPDSILDKKIKNFRVVGVVDDFHFQSLHTEIKPMHIFYDVDYSNCVGLSVKSEKLEDAVATVNSAYQEIYANSDLKISFLDQEIENFYQSEQKTGKLISLAAIVAIIISGLGLYGLISLSISQRAKELGIRKILGASLSDLGTILSKEYFLLLVGSFLVTMPLGVYLADLFLEDYAYRITLAWWIFPTAAVLSIVLAFLSVVSRIMKAANSNPVDSLRYE